MRSFKSLCLLSLETKSEGQKEHTERERVKEGLDVCFGLTRSRRGGHKFVERSRDQSSKEVE